MENLAKNAFSSFCSICWKFFKQTQLQSPENSKNILFLVLLSKMIIPEVIKAVALIKITTVLQSGLPNIVLQYYCSLKIKIARAYWAKIIIAAFCFTKK